MRLSIPPNTVPPALSEVEGTIARLQREVESATHEEQRALLLHETALLEEVGRDDHGAARDWLAAVNTHADFREPLEQLIALIERRKSVQNLGKLLDRLGRVASNEAEAVRAQLARGDFLTDHRAEPDAARAAYEIVLNSDARQPLAWLSLQYLAGKTSDAKLQERALAARIELAEEPSYRNELRLHLAALQEKRGRLDAALETLELAAAVDTSAQLPALRTLEHLAAAAGDTPRLANILERQFSLFAARARADVDGSEHPAASSRLQAADVALRGALCHQSLGAFARAANLLGQALELLPESEPLAHAQLAIYELLLDFERAAELAARLLRQGQREGSSRAALALRAVNLHLARGETVKALEGLDEVLRLDPQAIAARALQLNLLQQTNDAGALAFAYESIASQLTDGPGRARHYQLAALGYANSSEPLEAAKAALSQATASGTKPRTAARMGRLLATLRGNARWYQESTERLLRSGTAEELPNCLLELVRLCMLRGSHVEAFNYLGQLSSKEAGAWLGLVLASYYPVATESADPGGETKSGFAMRQLAQLLGGQQATALLQTLAYRDVRAGRLERAQRLLAELHEANPNEVHVAAQLATCQRAAGDDRAAARTLATAATHPERSELALPLLLEAGIQHWQSAERDAAVRCFEIASQLNPAAAGGLAHWSLCCARPDVPEARRRALESALAATGDRDAYAIERFALEVGIKGQAQAATAALASADDVGLGEGAQAVHFARALWPAAEQHADALRFLADSSPVGAEIASAIQYYAARASHTPDVDTLLAHARAWSEAGSLAAAIELFSAAVASASVEDEVVARRRIAAHLDADGHACMLAGAAIVEHLYLDTYPDLIQSQHAQARLANLELAPPGAAPRRRAQVLREADDCLGADNVPTLRALAAYNDLAAGNYEAAFTTFRELVEQLPGELFIWEGLRTCAASLARREEEAEACLQLGELCLDDARAAEFFRHAARLYDELAEPARATRALERAVALDVSDFDSFDAWFRQLRREDRFAELVELCTRRIQVTNAPKELTRLYWERARSERALGNLDSALSDLESVRALDASHVGARALAGEIHIGREDFARAAEELTELARLPQAPEEQRQLSGAAAIDLYESKLGDLPRALAVLELMQAARLDTLAVKERLARATAKAESWEDAARLLESLMQERGTHAARTQAARLALVIYRDRLRAPRRAENATRCLLTHAPTDSEAIDLVLKGSFPFEHAQVLLTEAKLALFDSLQTDVNADTVARLARIAEFLDDLPLRQVALGALVALGVTSSEILTELDQLDARNHPQPRHAIDAATADSILDPDETGAFSQITKLLAPDVAELFGSSPKTFGLGRAQRRKPAEAGDLWASIAAYAGALRLGDFEFYVGGSVAPDAVVAIPQASPPAIAVGEAVRNPLTASQRAELAPQVLSLVNGTFLLLNREPSEVAALLVAACRLCEFVPPSAAYALTPEFERLLRKQVSRRTRKELAELVHKVAASGADPLRWAEGARASLDRVALLATGDVSRVLLSAAERNQPERDLSLEREQRITRLIQFGLSMRFMKLREQLGMTGR